MNPKTNKWDKGTHTDHLLHRPHKKKRTRLILHQESNAFGSSFN
ncbi:hypothetical protein [Priestia megaterium]